MDEFIRLLNNLKTKFKNNKIAYYPFIEYIRFPKYKLLKENSRINFDFPITLLVGKNGTNKTSLLQALYGSPEGKSLGDYWFTTSVDKIDKEENENEDKHCLIYGYYFEKAKRVVEVLKTRVNKKEKLDYWEPSRPIKKYNMEILPKCEYSNLGSSSDTRWDGMNKNVVYCDCKEYVSAYDLFFYHYDFKKTKTQKSKQDFIRSRSKALSKVLGSDSQTYYLYNKEMVDYNIEMSEAVCNEVSEIMGESYSAIKIVTHNFYTKSSGNRPAKTIWMKKNGNIYSEAFAGTGEARIILLVNDILNATDNSLLLIDEPEISLHPSAIYKLKNFLLRECLKKNHQIVITTHSTQMVKDFPKEAIKLVSKINNEIKILGNIDYQDAFYELGDEFHDKKMVFVEDKLAKYIIEFIIRRENSQKLKENIEVRYIPGGADNIIQSYITSSAFQGLENCLFILDGDKKQDYNQYVNTIKPEYLNKGRICVSKIPESDYLKLGEIILKMTGNKIDIKVSGNKGNVNKEELLEAQKIFIDFWEKNVKFLPCDTPEIFLAELDNDPNFLDLLKKDKNGKEYFLEKTKHSLRLDEVTSEDIFEEQRRVVSKIDANSELYKGIVNMLKELF
ncbi:hypothetical protein HMPREF0491_01475 [Lachnospiraceae oral taxon 107 str. F0167]|jgi:hypothetical protein|uniref:AAA family ATPase n=1 Tax=Lachnoanaerobaculum sp. Marseille-Q4761 TaxID=2819511 RepID=UPI0002083571|nr:AAA family ATPase [Lachnoanaerobaculum sp. Marseille-Q4761]EGG92362.1 hypothetical protein HMPREF0491_01475 [Lachnospiraceae oral taxon 107 str. F0167]MBO1869942.1 ATP-binding protein [Lachnoanaerobaculum sp. Marseille-Q4761]